MDVENTLEKEVIEDPGTEQDGGIDEGDVNHDDEGAVIEGDGTDEGEAETEEKPLWLEDDDKAEIVPLKSHIALREKLKGKLTERDTEIERLRREIESIKSKPVSLESPLKRPVEWEYETTEEYHAALEAYEDAKIEARLNATKAKETNARMIKALEDGVNDHLSRAEKLIQEHKIAPEVYQSADLKLRKAVEAIAPGRGELIVNRFISAMGEGSEKVVFFGGKNEAQTAKIQSLLASDPTGIEAAIYMGRLQERLEGAKTKNIKTKAPDPAPNLKTGNAPSGEAALKKAYESAKDVQSQVEIRRKARAAGIDVKKW